MIKSVTITNHLDESITLDLFQPELSGFIIKSIDGLGPVDADVHMTELATLDGAIDNSARLHTRNIVMSLQFIGDPLIEDTRLKSYKYFPVKRKIRFTIETDNRLCYTEGRVEKNTVKIFDKNEGCQISILCPDPYFYSVEDTHLMFYGVDPLFEFPFENNSLTEDLIEFGEIRQMTEGTILYEGDAETGIIIDVHALGAVEGFAVYNSGTRERMGINDTKLEALMGSGIIEGDVITIDTTRGHKSIQLLRNGRTTNILNALEKPLAWFRLAKGYNTFVYTASAGLEYLQFAISYKTMYEGV